MGNELIPFSECSEILAKSRKLMTDSKVGDARKRMMYDTYLKRLKLTVHGLIRKGSREGFIDISGVNTIEGAVSFYDCAVAIDTSLGDEGREQAIQTLEKSVQFVKGFSRLTGKFKVGMSRTSGRIRQISEGEYYWSEHFANSRNLLIDLAEEGYEDAALKSEVDGFYDRLMIDFDESTGRYLWKQ